MNFKEFSVFYGIGFCIQALNNELMPIFSDDGKEVAFANMNGIIIDFLCFRLILGNVDQPTD